MKKVFSDQNIALVGSMRSYLEEHGIVSQMRNEHSSSFMGEIPFFSVYPELWVNDENVEQATLLIKKMQEVDLQQQSSEWNCQACNEQNPGNFQVCWNCGVAMT